jgi:internalin A
VTDLSLSLTDLAGLQSLDLRGTGVTDLAPLASLVGLQSLDLSNTGVTDLSPLGGLVGLQSLNLSETGVTDLSPLAGLAGLQSLDLRLTGVRDFSPLAGLARLQSLDLTVLDITDLSPLGCLTELQSLNLMVSGKRNPWQWTGLNHSRTRVTDLSPLAGLVRLQSLNLAVLGVTDLWPLAGLSRLQSLNLSHTGVPDLSPLAGLTELHNLDLSATGAMDLSPLAGLTRLQSLDLRDDGVTDISPLAGLTELQRLDLSFTCVTDLSPLARLQSLTYLDIANSRSTISAPMLRIVSDLPRMTELIANRAIGLPQEVISRHDRENCLPRIRAYFAEVDLGSVPENEVKVILLGNGRVGKTQLCRRLRGEPYDKIISSTHGVQIWRQELRLAAGDQEETFQVNWWDFGGQDIYHGTHALFLRSRALFLILWTPNLENRKEWSEDGIPQRNQLLAYWLAYVRSLAGRGSPVIVVQSQCDTFADRRPDPARPEGVEFFECCACSAKTDLGREVLEGHLRNALRSLIETTGHLQIGRGRAELRRRLYEWRKEDQERQASERRNRTLTLDSFRALCDETGGIVSWEHALDYLHQTGVVFHRPDLFDNRIVLDQSWTLDAVYTVFHRGRAVPLLRDSGRFTREDLALISWQDYSIDDQKHFLGLMESCGICFPCGKTAAGETRYVAPDLLPAFDTIKGRLYAWKNEPGAPTLRLDFRFLHPAAFRDLMGRVGRRAGDAAEYWKYGFWLKDAETGSQILVQVEDTSTEADPGAGSLVLQAQGRDPQRLLRTIRNVLLWYPRFDVPEERLTLGGTTVARSALDSAIDGRVLDVQGRSVGGAAFSSFFAYHDPSTNASHDPAGAATVAAIKAIPASADDKPREVFISYAWGDATSEGKIRDQAVQRLQSVLAIDGFQPVRDRDQMRTGERISAFMRRLTRADQVVAIISDKYLRSPFCMYELYKLWQRSQGDADDLLQHLVPIILPDVQLSTWEDREPYLEYWSARAEKLKASIRRPHLRPSRESWEEVRLVEEFAHHLDGILVFLQNSLVPRSLEAQLADNFAAVRWLLRERPSP